MKMHAVLVCLVLSFAFTRCEEEDLTCLRNEEVGDPCKNPDKRCPSIQARDVVSNTSCEGCVCDPGFVRTILAECITPEQCDLCKDKKFEVFQSCGTACPLICNHTYPSGCSRLCVPGCFCLYGYIRSSKNGTCVPIEDCPPTCKNNVTMIYTTCRSPCPPTCNVDSKLCLVPCTEDGCVCRNGFLRVSPSNDTCVTKEDCPPPS